MANLPKLSYKELSKLPMGKQRKLGYETHALNRGADVVIYHHSHPIAVVQKHKVLISKCGYDSNTTRDRLDQVVRDNFGYEIVRVCKDKHVMKLNVMKTKVLIPFETAEINRNGEVRIVRY